MSEYCIELNNLTKRFGKFTAVDNFSLQLLPGKVYGIVGPNGAGKSTTMAMIMGSLQPTEGTGNVMGHQLGSEQALKILGYSPEFTSFYDDMSCVEYLWYMGTLGGLSNEEAMEKAMSLIKQYDLVEHAYKKVSKFSTGMKKKVSLAQAMIHDPQILLLDEPTANLDPSSRMEILDTVRKMVQERKLTVLISSHVLTELETVIDHVVMINHGKLIMDEDIVTAQEKFKQGILVVNCNNNDLLLEKLENKYDVEKSKDSIRIMTSDVSILKKEVVKVIFENDLILNVLHEEVLSIDLLYKQRLKEKINETYIFKNFRNNNKVGLIVSILISVTVGVIVVSTNKTNTIGAYQVVLENVLMLQHLLVYFVITGFLLMVSTIFNATGAYCQ